MVMDFARRAQLEHTVWRYEREYFRHLGEDDPSVRRFREIISSRDLAALMHEWNGLANHFARLRPDIADWYWNYERAVFELASEEGLVPGRLATLAPKLRTEFLQGAKVGRLRAFVAACELLSSATTSVAPEVRAAMTTLLTGSEEGKRAARANMDELAAACGSSYLEALRVAGNAATARNWFRLQMLASALAKALGGTDEDLEEALCDIHVATDDDAALLDAVQRAVRSSQALGEGAGPDR
jgi:hypothetical protein